MKTILPSV